MRYVIIGAGAIGGTVGAHLVRGGESVLFVDLDGEHVRAMQARGLTIRGFDETFNVQVEAVTPDGLPDRIDMVLLACKAPATEAAVRSFADRLAPDGCVVSLQNGLNELTIRRLVGQQRTIGAFVNFSADYLEPGLIHFGGRGAFWIGELDGALTPRLTALQQALGHWGNVQVTDNIWGFLWGKQAYGAMLFATALTNDTMADAIDQHRGVAVDLAREVLRVAAAEGVQPLGFDGFEPDAIGSADPAVVEASLARLIAVRRGDEKTRSGVWRDMAVRKRRTEVDAHFGPIVEYAQRDGLEVPVLRRMIEMIHAVEERRRPFSSANLDELAEASGAHLPSRSPGGGGALGRLASRAIEVLVTHNEPVGRSDLACALGVSDEDAWNIGVKLRGLGYATLDEPNATVEATPRATDPGDQQRRDELLDALTDT